MFDTPYPVALITADQVAEFGRKAAALKALVAKEPASADEKIAEHIEVLLEFYEDAQMLVFEKRTEERAAEFEEDLRMVAEIEDQVITYLVVQRPLRAHVERQSSKWI